MLGYAAPEEEEEPGLLRPRARGLAALRSRLAGSTCAAVSAASLLLLGSVVGALVHSSTPPIINLSAKPPADRVKTISAAAVTPPPFVPTPLASRWHGVSLGGWLLMEINPSKLIPPDNPPPDMRPYWMFDQIEARSELDLVTALREEGGDDFAITTMTNHWANYITEEMLDAARAVGVDAVRIPVGYWIMDTPVGGSSPLEYGFSPEGFVTGGLNHLLAMLVKLKKRGMVALIDMHAHPCNSACVSNGLSCAGPIAFTPKGGIQFYDYFLKPDIGDLPKCGGGVYKTSRVASQGQETWGDVGVASVGAMAAWIAGLPKEAASVVCAFQLANEPALGPPGYFDDEVNHFYHRALVAARSHLPTLPLIISFMGPRPSVIDFFKTTALADSAGGDLLGDHHYYENWQSPPLEPFDWTEIHRRACVLEAEGQAHDVDVYAAFNQKLIIGEWSLATNHDMKRDLDDPQTVAELKKFFKEQLDIFSRKAVVTGTFFWTLRMGSGWDPRPSDGYPHGRQADGTSAWRSIPDYPFRVWSLLEMARAGIVSPLNVSYAGSCPGL